MADIDRTLFDKLADEFINAGEVQPGTMMGFPCLRVRGRYIACKDKTSGTLIVKLTEKHVKNLVESGLANSSSNGPPCPFPTKYCGGEFSGKPGNSS